MADVFISYKPEDAEPVRRLIGALRVAGVSTWWSGDIALGEPWRTTIERKFAEARAVIVAWSPVSCASAAIKSEARRAKKDRKLIQVFIGPCKPPLSFSFQPGIDLSAWSGDAGDLQFQALLVAIRAVIAGERLPGGVGHHALRKRPWAIATAAGAGTLLVSGIGLTADIMGLRSMLSDPDAEARAALLGRIEGVWGNVGGARPACEDTLRYSVEHRGRDDYVTVSGQGFSSEARVVSADDASVFTRTVLPSREAGAQWELRLEADRLIQVDSKNIGTTLVRCGS